MRTFKTITAETPAKFDAAIQKFYQDNPEVDAPINAEFSTSSVTYMSQAPANMAGIGKNGIIEKSGPQVANLQIVTLYTVTIEYNQVEKLEKV